MMPPGQRPPDATLGSPRNFQELCGKWQNFRFYTIDYVVVGGERLDASLSAIDSLLEQLGDDLIRMGISRFEVHEDVWARISRNKEEAVCFSLNKTLADNIIAVCEEFGILLPPAYERNRERTVVGDSGTGRDSAHKSDEDEKVNSILGDDQKPPRKKGRVGYLAASLAAGVLAVVGVTYFRKQPHQAPPHSLRMQKSPRPAPAPIPVAVPEPAPIPVPPPPPVPLPPAPAPAPEPTTTLARQTCDAKFAPGFGYSVGCAEPAAYEKSTGTAVKPARSWAGPRMKEADGTFTRLANIRYEIGQKVCELGAPVPIPQDRDSTFDAVFTCVTPAEAPPK